MSHRYYIDMPWYLLATIGPRGKSYTHRGNISRSLDDILTVCKNGRAKYAVLQTDTIEKLLVFRIADISYECTRMYYADDRRLTPVGEYSSVHEAVMATILLYEY